MNKYLITFIAFISASSTICINMQNNNDSKAIIPFFNSQPAIMYTPWRGDYVQNANTLNAAHISTQNTPQTSDCIFCKLLEESNDEALILYRGKYNYVLVNKKPYVSKGYHLLIIPYEHKKQLIELSYETRQESQLLETLIFQQLSSDDCYEMQILYHIGPLAGASIPNHIHKHIICDKSPRYYNLIDAMENTVQPEEPFICYKELAALLEFEEQPIPNNYFSSSRNSSCYYCKILNENNDEKNLIIHRGNYVTILFSHKPSSPGLVIIIPNHHCSSEDHLSPKAQDEMHDFTLKIYPLLTSLLKTPDINFGLISYQKNTKKHLKQKLVPRTKTHEYSPGLNKYIITQDMKKLYAECVEKFNETNIQQQQ